jgi:uncharacterized protein YciI
MARLFAVTRTRGGAWNATRDMDQQAAWDAHADFMDGLVTDGVVLHGGPLQATPDVLLIVQAKDEVEVRARLSGDPWHRSDLLRISSVKAWTPLLGPHAEA